MSIPGRVLLVLALCGAGALQAATDQVAVPPLTQRVTDLTATLAPDVQTRLEARLRAFEARKGSQVAVLIVPTTQPETIEQYGIRVAEQWKLGRSKVDDGAILLVAKTDRTVRIEVGYGLEGVLNDATAQRIISELIVPRLRDGDFGGGIEAGVDRMIRTIDGEALPAPVAVERRGGLTSLHQILPVAVLLAVVLGGVLRAVLGPLPGAVLTGAIIGGLTWFVAGILLASLAGAAIGFFFTLLGGGSGRGGGWYGGPGGGGFGGGGIGGGGGFGGGGGGFGGGGASGRW